MAATPADGGRSRGRTIIIDRVHRNAQEAWGTRSTHNGPLPVRRIRGSRSGLSGAGNEREWNARGRRTWAASSTQQTGMEERTIGAVLASFAVGALLAGLAGRAGLSGEASRPGNP